MERSALRSIYGNSQHKTKHAAAVSPILDQSDLDDESLNPSADRDGRGQRNLSNNWSSTVNMINTPQDDEDGDEATKTVLQRKSAQYEIPPLVSMSLRDSAPLSNQDGDGVTLPPSSGSAQKYVVLGQKQQWRKSRAQRSRRFGQTISPVEEDPSDTIEDDVDLENPTSSLETDVSPRFSIHEMSSRSSSRGDSERYESEWSNDRTSSFSGDETKRFVVTRQKKSKFSAKIHLPGQNPLYLGRYKSAEAALAACEQAFATVTTPRK